MIRLAAFTSRHRRRWYRVRRLGADDVAAVVRLVKALRPIGARIGFVVDDLGRDDRQGFDPLLEELPVLDRASRGWRGLTRTAAGLRQLQDLRR